MGNDYQKGLSAIPGNWMGQLGAQNQQNVLYTTVYTYSLFGHCENKSMVTHSTQTTDYITDYKITNWVMNART